MLLLFAREGKYFEVTKINHPSREELTLPKLPLYVRPPNGHLAKMLVKWKSLVPPASRQALNRNRDNLWAP